MLHKGRLFFIQKAEQLNRWLSTKKGYDSVWGPLYLMCHDLLFPELAKEIFFPRAYLMRIRCLLIALLPFLFFAVHNVGLTTLKALQVSHGIFLNILVGIVLISPLFFSSLGCALFWEWLRARKTGSPMNPVALVMGILMLLIVPSTLVFWKLCLVFSVALCWTLFVGKGWTFYLFHPVLLAKFLLLVFFPASFFSSPIWGHSAARVASALMISPDNPLQSLGLLKSYGFTLHSLFWGWVPGAIGSSGIFLCIWAAWYLAKNRMINIRLLLIFIGSVFVAGFVVSHLPFDPPFAYWKIPGYWHLYLEGLAFSALFFVLHPITLPVHPIAKHYMVIGTAILLIVVRGLSPYPGSDILVFLFMGSMAPLLDEIFV